MLAKLASGQRGKQKGPTRLSTGPFVCEWMPLRSESPGQIALYGTALGPLGELTGPGDTDQGVGAQGQIESAFGLVRRMQRHALTAVRRR